MTFSGHPVNAADTKVNVKRKTQNQSPQKKPEGQMNMKSTFQIFLLLLSLYMHTLIQCYTEIATLLNPSTTLP